MGLDRNAGITVAKRLILMCGLGGEVQDDILQSSGKIVGGHRHFIHLTPIWADTDIKDVLAALGDMFEFPEMLNAVCWSVTMHEAI